MLRALLLSVLLMVKLHLLAPPSDVLLLHTADGERSFRNILRYGGAGTDRGSTSHFDGSHQLHIRSHKDAITDDRLMFLESIIVAGDGPSPDVDLFSDERISDIGEVVGFGTLTDDRFLHLYEVSDLCLRLHFAQWSQVGKGPDGGPILDPAFGDDRVGTDCNSIADFGI